MKKQTVLMVILSLSLFFLGLFLGSQSASIPSKNQEIAMLQEQLSAIQAEFYTLQKDFERIDAWGEENRVLAQNRRIQVERMQGRLKEVIELKNQMMQRAGSGLTQKELKEFGKMVEYKGYLLPSWPASLGITIPNVDVEAIRQYKPEDKELFSREYTGRNESRILDIGLSAPVVERMLLFGEVDVAYNYWTIGQFKSYQRYALDVQHAFTREYEGKGIYPGDLRTVDSLSRWRGLSPTGAKVKERLGEIYSFQLEQAIALIDADPELQKVFKKQ